MEQEREEVKEKKRSKVIWQEPGDQWIKLADRLFKEQAYVMFNVTLFMV